VGVVVVVVVVVSPFHSRVMWLQPVSQLPDPEDELRDLATQCEAEARAQLPAGATFDKAAACHVMLCGRRELHDT
jgi:hypothetical protein